MEVSLVFSIASSLAVVAVVCFFLHLCETVWFRCRAQLRKLRMQGIDGPSPSFLYGNVPEMKRIELKAKKAENDGEIVAHDYAGTLFPYFEHWRKEYGLVYTYSTGFKQHLYVNDPELVNQMNQSITLDLGKPSYVSKRLAPMLGNGIGRANGQFWALQRKIIAPPFFMDKVKGMVRLMVETAQPLLAKWEQCIESQGGVQADIKVDEDLRELSADVIARACFGSSYYKGKEIFSKLRSLQKSISKQAFLFGVPSFGFLPTKNRKEISYLQKEVDALIWETVKERERECLETPSSQKDLMQMILEGAVNDTNPDKVSSKRFIIDNCKNIYFAGHESTAATASWCLMLLALHPEWQSRIRTEVNQFCKDGLPVADSLSKLKTVTMVIQETMRLYPVGAFVSREALEDTRIGNIIVPKGVCIWTLIPTLHRDPDLWGEDANQFKPERFNDGLSKACKFPKAYIPFGLGPRMCLGQNLAMVELKVVLSLIISKFTLSLSPSYRHSPAYRMIVEPEHGVNILLRKI